MSRRLISCIAVVLFLAIGVRYDASAETHGWSLRYVKGAPYSEYKDQDNQYYDLKNGSAKMTVDKLSSGAKIFLMIDVKNTALFSHTGELTANGITPINKRVWFHASFSGANYGHVTNRPSGRIIY